MGEILDFYEDEFGEEIPTDSLILKMLLKFHYTDTNFVSYANVSNGSKAFETWASQYYIPGNKRTMTVEKRFLDLYKRLLALQAQREQKKKQQLKNEISKQESQEPNIQVNEASDDELNVEVSPVESKPTIVESFDVDDELKLSDVLIDRGRDVYVDGKLIQRAQLANTNKRQIRISDSSIFIVKDMFSRYLKDNDLLDAIPWTTLLDSYIVYMAASSKESIFKKPSDWVDWCIANAFANVKNLPALSNALDSIKSLNDIIYDKSNKFSHTFRWYVFLSTVTPTAFKNYEIRELLRKQDQLDDSLLVITGLLASLLSVATTGPQFRPRR